MKHKLFLLLLVFAALNLMTSCHSDDLRDEAQIVSQSAVLKINTRSVVQGENVGLPIRLFVFDAEGVYVTSLLIENATENADKTLELPAGSYTVLAFTGASSDVFEFPTESITTTSLVTLKDAAALSRVEFAASEVTLTAGDAKELSMEVSPIVDKASFNLSNVPEDVTGVSVTMGKLHNGICLDGTFPTDATGEEVTFSLTKGSEDGVWELPTAYVLPAIGTSVTISVTVTTATETKKYVYTSSVVPQGSKEFNVSLSVPEKEEEKASLSFNITSKGWTGTSTVSGELEEVVEDESDEDNTKGKQGTGEYYVVESLPEVATLWNGCIVAAVTDKTATSEKLLLMSPYEWFLQVKSMTDEKTIADAVAGYVVEGIKETWTYPSSDDAQLIINNLGESANLASVNTLLKNNSMTLLYGDEKDTKNQVAYYLCCGDDSQLYKFKIVSNFELDNFIGTSRNYCLRAVCWVTVSLNN